jgi:hypothetical protein
MICTLFIRDRDFGCVGHVDLALVRLRLYATLSGIAPTLTRSPTGRRLRSSLLRLRSLALSLRRLLRRLYGSSLLHAGVFPMVWMQPTLPIKNGVSFLIKVHEACLCPYLLQLKHGRLSSRLSYFEQYAPVAPKITVPDWRRCSVASLLLS